LNVRIVAYQPKAKAALHEIWMADTRSDAHRAFDQFIATFDAKYPKAVECLAKDRILKIG
jgi:putative transposase